MTSKPLLIMVGADKGGVGKTTLARTLLDYLTENNVKFRAFDTEAPYGVLKRFFENSTEILDLTTSANQMVVFDTLSPATVTVIDVRAGLLSPTLETLGNVGLLEMVKSGQINMIIMHVLGPTLASLREIEATSNIITGSTHFLVKNHVNKSTFFEWDKDAHDAILGNPRSGIIDIPQLNELAAEHVENKGMSYGEFIKDNTQSMVLRGYVNTWLKTVFKEYNKVNLDKTLVT